MASITENIAMVAAGFAQIDRLDPCSEAYSYLCAILDTANDEALIAVHQANIRFASKLAFNRMIRRGLVQGE